MNVFLASYASRRFFSLYIYCAACLIITLKMTQRGDAHIADVLLTIALKHANDFHEKQSSLRLLFRVDSFFTQFPLYPQKCVLLFELR